MFLAIIPQFCFVSIVEGELREIVQLPLELSPAGKQKFESTGVKGFLAFLQIAGGSICRRRNLCKCEKFIGENENFQNLHD